LDTEGLDIRKEGDMATEKKPRKKTEGSGAKYAQRNLKNPAVQKKIAEKAYFRFLNRGHVPGEDQEDWLQAEKEVLEEFKAQTGTRRSPKRQTDPSKAPHS
jgi:hypothetical protein